MSGEEQSGVASSDSNLDSRQTSPVKARHAAGLQVFHKGLLLVFSPLLIQIVLIASLALVLLQLDQESLKESRYRRCAAIGAHLIALGNLAAIDVMVWFQSSSPEVLSAYDRAVGEIKSEEKQLKELTSNDRLAQKSAAELIESIDKLAAMLDSIAALAKQRNFLELAAVIPRLDKELKTSKSTHLEHISSVTIAQEKIAEESTRRQDALRIRQNNIIWLALLSNGMLAIFLFIYYKKSIFNRIKVVRENTERLAEGKALAAPLSGSDEIAQLDRAFHQMNLDLHAARERERSLFENASDVICVLDLENRFVRINQACKSRWGRTVAELHKNSIRSICNYDDADRAEQLFRAARNGAEYSCFDLTILGADGAALETLWSTYWSANEQQLYAVVPDVSERKRIERIKEAYLAMISSDLRLPLASIARAADKLAANSTKSLSEQALERIEIVRKNIARLLLLVSDLLELSELESGTLKLRPELCKIEPLLSRSAQDLEGLAQTKQISFRIECSATYCWLDPHKIIQVIVNLASNAVKFSPTGAEIIFRASQSADYLLIEVIDFGRGVPAEHKESIFEKFRQVELSDAKRKAGTGLGLPICKDIVEKHGGEIGVISEGGQGSKFWFRIPSGLSAIELSVPAVESIARADSLSAPSPVFAADPISKSTPGSLMSLNQKGLLLILLPLSLQFIFVLSILNVIAQVNANRQEELKQRVVAATAFEIMNSFYKMIVSLTPSSQEELWLAFDECARREQKDRVLLSELLSHDSTALRQFKAADRACVKLDPAIQKLREGFGKEGYSDKLFDELHPGRIQVIAVSSAVSRRLLVLIDEVEKKQAISPLQQAELRKSQGGILLAGLIANVALSIFLARFFAKNISTRLARLADNTVKLARHQALSLVLPGTDEIAQLDAAFHITAEKLLEARKKERAVFDNSHDLIASLDADLRFVALNLATERILGFPRDELVKMSISNFFTDNDCKQLLELFRSEKRSLAVVSLETLLSRKDGKPLYLQWSFSRSHSDDNIYCVAHDITGRKQLEQLKQDFLAIVSHDLRNPLGSVMGFVSLLLAGAFAEPGPDARQLLELIMTESAGLLSLINDLLDLEKLEAQCMQLVFAEESAGKVAYQAYEAVKDSCPGLSLDFAEDSDEEVVLRCDMERLSQGFSSIFTHLYRRNLRLSGDKQLQIKIKFERLPDETVCWNVANCGIPYSELEIKAMFERFQIFDRAGSGSGDLALLIAKRLLEAHGGSLVLASDATTQQYFVMKVPASG